jgi:uncharacterized protein (TIGR02453 family)
MKMFLNMNGVGNMKHESLFRGFTPDTIQFLDEIAANNNKPWFESNKERYRSVLLEPLQDLVCALSETALAIDPFIVTQPSVGRTISRIYRDTRFSKDKSLLRNCMWLTFKRPTKEWLEAPAFFFEITPGGYRYGMGFYSASKGAMDAFRQAIDEDPEEFLKAVAFYKPGEPFNLEGEQYKRIIDPTKPPAIQDWYQRKSFYLACNHGIDDLLFTPELAKVVADSFLLAAPLYTYLWKTKGRTER